MEPGISRYGARQRALAGFPRYYHNFNTTPCALQHFRLHRYKPGWACIFLPHKEFRYLRTVIVTAAVYWGFNSRLAPLLLTFQHRAGVRPYTSILIFAESCVLGKQSLPPSLCHLFKVALKKVPLLPKLRGQFAEFLQHHSLKRLSILYSSTSVGFGYGLLLELFPGSPSVPLSIR